MVFWIHLAEFIGSHTVTYDIVSVEIVPVTGNVHFIGCLKFSQHKKCILSIFIWAFSPWKMPIIWSGELPEAGQTRRHVFSNRFPHECLSPLEPMKKEVVLVGYLVLDEWLLFVTQFCVNQNVFQVRTTRDSYFHFLQLICIFLSHLKVEHSFFRTMPRWWIWYWNSYWQLTVLEYFLGSLQWKGDGLIYNFNPLYLNMRLYWILMQIY